MTHAGGRPAGSGPQWGRRLPCVVGWFPAFDR
jgi:hypothetical protein